MCYQHLTEITLSPIQNKAITYSSQQLRDINNIKNNKLYLRLNPGTIKKVRDYRINRWRVTTATRYEHRPRGINTQNLITVRTIDFGGKVTTPYLTIATLNTRSVKNKDQLLFQELTGNNIDIGLITETWLKDMPDDEAWVNQSQLQQNSYKTWLLNWPSDHCGGGLALIHKNHIWIKDLKNGNTLTIEYGVWKATIHNKMIRLMGIYTHHQVQKTKQLACSSMR